MTRNEIREAIKKVFFEEIEPDSLTKSSKANLKNINQTYKTLDGKYTFKSKHEILAYNIFDKEGISDQIKPQDRQFLKTCNKIPDFVWENKKIIIEIAGMDDNFKPGYWEKLENAKPCLEKQGYTVYVIDTRQRSPYYNYIKFYDYLCDLLGFTPKPEIKDDIFSYIGDPIDIIKRNQEIVQYKRDNQNVTTQQIANKFNITTKTVYDILKPAGLTTPLSQTQARNQARNQEIVQYKRDNRNATYQEIANKFNITTKTVQNILKPAGLITPLSQTQARNQEIIQYVNDNPEFKSKPAKIAKKFNLPVTTIDHILMKLKKSNPTNEQSINYKTMTRKELREIIKKAFLKEVGEKTAFINGKPVEYREESELARLKDNSDIRSITTAGGRKFK